MFDSYLEFIPVSTQILIFLTAAWHILLIEKKNVDHLWLFFSLFSSMFTFCYLLMHHFPFMLFTFYTAFISINVFITLFIYSYPRSKLINYPWFFIAGTVTVVLLYVFHAYETYRDVIYFLTAVAFTMMHAVMLFRKKKYLKYENGYLVLIFLSLSSVWSSFFSMVNYITVYYYNTTLLEYIFLLGVPLFFFLFLFLFYKQISTESTFSFFLFMTFFFFALPVSFAMIYMSPMRVLLLPYITTEHFFLAGTVIVFIVYNLVSLLILSVSTLIDNYFNKRHKQLRRIVAEFRSEITRYASYSDIINHLRKTLLNKFKETEKVEVKLFSQQHPAVGHKKEIEYDEELKISPVTQWLKNSSSHHFLLKRMLNISPEIKSWLKEQSQDLVIPFRQKKDIIGLVLISGKSFDKTSSDAIASIVDSAGEAFLRADLFSQVLEKEKQLKEREHFQETGKVISFIAHELRTPLSSVIFNMDVILDSVNKGNEIDVEYLEITHSELSRLNSTIDRMLTYGRDIKLSLSENNFMQFFRELEFIYASEKIPIRFNNGCLNIPYFFDWERVRDVVVNLVNNSIQAIKNSEHEGFVEISVNEKNSTIKLTVSDTGPGIPEDAQESIFEPFFTTKQQGNGLGLAICEKIIRLSGGHIILRETSSNGTVFDIILPVNEPPIPSLSKT